MTRIAVVGCGFYAQNHLQSWRDLAPAGAELVAVCDIDLAKAEAAGQAFGAPAFTDPVAMAEAARPDLVDVVTRMDTHRSLAEALAPRVPGLIIQKPFAPTLGDARAIVAAADEAGAWLAVHENFRWQPPLRRAIALVDEGAIGAPSWARVSFRTGFDVYRTQPYFLTEERLVIADVGVHVLDVARRTLGEVSHLTAEIQRRNPRLVGEDTATMLLRHASGAVSVVEATYESRREPDPFPDTLLEVEGPEGAIAVLAAGGIELTRGGRMEVLPMEAAVPPWMDPRWAMSQLGCLEACRHFLRAFRAGAPAETSGRDNLRTAALVEAAYLSADTGQAQRPEPTP